MTKSKEYYYVKCGLCDTEYRSDVAESCILTDDNGGQVCFECKEQGLGAFKYRHEEDVPFNTQDMLE